MRRTLLLLLFPALIACSDPSGPEGSVPVQLEFGVSLPAVEPAFRVEGADRSVVVTGSFEALCSPYDATAAAAREGDVLVLRVVGRHPGACFDVVQTVRYVARIGPVPAGQYDLQIVHEWADTGLSRELAHQQTVTVR